MRPSEIEAEMLEQRRSAAAKEKEERRLKKELQEIKLNNAMRKATEQELKLDNSFRKAKMQEAKLNEEEANLKEEEATLERKCRQCTLTKPIEQYRLYYNRKKVEPRYLYCLTCESLNHAYNTAKRKDNTKKIEEIELIYTKYKELGGIVPGNAIRYGIIESELKRLGLDKKEED